MLLILLQKGCREPAWVPALGRLVSAILLERFLDPDAQRLHHGEVVEREEEGFFGLVEIDMLVPGPGRYAEDVVRFPVEAFTADDRIAAAGGNIINDIARVPVRLAAKAGFEHLHMSPHRLESPAAG